MGSCGIGDAASYLPNSDKNRKLGSSVPFAPIVADAHGFKIDYSSEYKTMENEVPVGINKFSFTVTSQG